METTGRSQVMLLGEDDKASEQDRALIDPTEIHGDSGSTRCLMEGESGLCPL